MSKNNSLLRVVIGFYLQDEDICKDSVYGQFRKMCDLFFDVDFNDLVKGYKIVLRSQLFEDQFLIFGFIFLEILLVISDLVQN